MLSGRYWRFSHLSRLNVSSLVRCSIDEGNSLMPLSPKYKISKHPISEWKLGRFSSPEQLVRQKYLRDFNLSWLGRNWSFLQWARFHLLSFSRDPKYSSISTKFLQKARSKFSKFGARNLGNFVIYSQHSRLTSFKFSKRHSCRENKPKVNYNKIWSKNLTKSQFKNIHNHTWLISFDSLMQLRGISIATSCSGKYSDGQWKG